jgi:hypothetical protein
LFAAGVLAVLAFLLVLGIAAHMAVPAGQTTPTEAGRAVFDSLIKVVPPIITLVLGFYFGQTSTAPTASEQSPPQGRTKADAAKGTAAKTRGTAGAASATAPDSAEAQTAVSAPTPKPRSSAGGASETAPKAPEGQPNQPGDTQIK